MRNFSNAQPNPITDPERTAQKHAAGVSQALVRGVKHELTEASKMIGNAEQEKSALACAASNEESVKHRVQEVQLKVLNRMEDLMDKRLPNWLDFIDYFLDEARKPEATARTKANAARISRDVVVSSISRVAGIVEKLREQNYFAPVQSGNIVNLVSADTESQHKRDEDLMKMLNRVGAFKNQGE